MCMCFFLLLSIIRSQAERERVNFDLKACASGDEAGAREVWWPTQGVGRRGERREEAGERGGKREKNKRNAHKESRGEIVLLLRLSSPAFLFLLVSAN